jgi:O-antigen/teichoic acid export membrane protein
VSRKTSALTVMTGSSIAQVAVFAVMSVLSTRLLGAHGRGLMVVGTAVGSTMALLAGMGSGAYLRARLPLLTGLDRSRLLASFTWWTMLGSLISAILAVALSLASARLIDSEFAQPRFLCAVLAVTFGYVAFSQFTEPWYAAGEFRVGSVWATVVAGSGLIAMLVAVLFSRSASVLLLAQGLGMTFMAVTQASHLHRHGLLTFRRPARRDMLDLLWSGSPALGLTVGLAITLKADRYILGAVAGASAVGVYALVSTLSELPRLIPASFGQVVMRETAVGITLRRARRAVGAAVIAAAVIGVAVAAGGSLLLGPVFGPEFADASPLLLVMLVAELAFAPFAVASRGLLGGGHTRMAGTIGVVGGLVAVLLFIVLIPVWGTYGAAASCLTVYGGMSLVSWRLFRDRLGVRIAMPRSPAISEPAKTALTTGSEVP